MSGLKPWSETEVDRVPELTVVPHEPVSRRRSQDRKGWDVFLDGRWMPEAEARAAGAYDRPMPTHAPSAVTRRQGPKEQLAEPPRVNRGFGRNYPAPKEEEPMTMLADRIAEAAETPAKLVCPECGKAFVPEAHRHGRPQVTCTPECMAARRRRLSRERDAAAAAAQHSTIMAAESASAEALHVRPTSTDQVPATPDLVVAEHAEPIVDPMHEFDGPYTTDEPDPPPLGDQIRIGAIEVALEEANKDLARLAEVAERAANERDYARVAVSWLHDKLASLQPAEPA